MSNINAITSVISTEQTGSAGTVATSAAEQAETDFSAVLADTMRDQMTRASATVGGGLSGMPVGYLPIQNQGIEQAILGAASSGNMDDAQIAMFMLCMMMQTNQGGEFSMLMQAMATMLMQIQGDKEALRSSVMSSDFDPYVLDMLDMGAFRSRMPDVSGTGQAVLPVEQWRPTTPSITSGPEYRSPELYRAVIDQFQVETAERYRPFRNGNTYCNIYVWDVTRAMGAEIPLYTDPATGEPRYYPDTKGAKSMGAIAMDQWLATRGPAYGWREVDAETAQMYANQGHPAVTTAGSLGHVQIVCPSKDGGFDTVRGVTIAQAGRIVTNYTHISSIYGGNALNSNVRYWVYDRPAALQAEEPEPEGLETVEVDTEVDEVEAAAGEADAEYTGEEADAEGEFIAGDERGT